MDIIVCCTVDFLAKKRHTYICRCSATLEKSVTAYFDAQGALAENIFKADVLSVLRSFERQFKKTK